MYIKKELIVKLKEFLSIFNYPFLASKENRLIILDYVKSKKRY